MDGAFVCIRRLRDARESRLGPTIAIAPGTIDTDDRGEVCGALVNARSTPRGLASVSGRCPWNQLIPYVTTSFPVRPAHSLYDQVTGGIGS